MTKRRAGWYGCYYGKGGVRLDDPDRPVGHYGSKVWARSLKDARRVTAARNLGESVGYGPTNSPDGLLPSQLLSKRRANEAEVMHAAIFLCWIAYRSGTMTPDDMLSDEGLLHQLAHHFQFSDELLIPKRRKLVDRLRALESRVPGVVAPEQKRAA